MIWCAATLERANGDGMGDIKNADKARALGARREGRTREARDEDAGAATDDDAIDGGWFSR